MAPDQHSTGPDPDEVFGLAAELRTARLTLRPVSESDGPGLFDIFGDERVTEHYAWDTFTSIAEAEALAASTAAQFRAREALRWGLVRHGADRIIGTCGYTRWNQAHRFAVVGYDLASAHWRQGLMTETLTAVLDFGFAHMGLNRVEASVMSGNNASAALLSRMGFTLEGELRSRGLYRGVVRDIWIFGLLHREYRDGRQPDAT